ncbi:Solute carrier family 2, facilitated glucose transporter member 2 [Frankliniella fusca]|uniref:Solute carrier family 2, facilitated glucose transporter member 2 n=1 Tax=Frankliniella fusca TaxID=407009 RepID=A0AAE1GRX3_9NEOP|nr:Solute carrier family 2, facilitated glucose transporter member 2 [Frankliniella fusca]
MRFTNFKFEIQNRNESKIEKCTANLNPKTRINIIRDKSWINKDVSCCTNCRMVLVSINRVTRRLLGLFAILLALAALLLFFGQMRYVYHQHLKFKRYESYSRYVDDVTNDLLKLEKLANNSNINMDQFFVALGQQPVHEKENSLNISQITNGSIVNLTGR